jgi:hypothetical protein
MRVVTVQIHMRMLQYGYALGMYCCQFISDGGTATGVTCSMFQVVLAAYNDV